MSAYDIATEGTPPLTHTADDIADLIRRASDVEANAPLWDTNTNRECIEKLTGHVRELADTVANLARVAFAANERADEQERRIDTLERAVDERKREIEASAKVIKELHDLVLELKRDSRLSSFDDCCHKCGASDGHYVNCPGLRSVDQIVGRPLSLHTDRSA